MAKNTENQKQAVEWLVSLQRQQEPSRSDLEEWEQWISDPEHQKSFDEIVEVWNRVGMVGPLPVPDAEELAADDYDGSETIAEWSARHERNAPAHERLDSSPDVQEGAFTLAPPTVHARQLRRWRGRLALAAAAAIALIGWIAYPSIWSTFSDEPQLFETSVAEHRTVELQDGSEVLLGAQTSLWVTYTRHRRIIVLDRGEALFDVARDPQRPFSVYAGYGTITAVGTSFAVHRDREHVQVTVAEGIVRVEPRATIALEERSGTRSVKTQPVVATLTKGQQVSYDERGSGNVSIVRVDAELATAWRDGRLQYVDEPLRNVIADVNRYSKRQIVLDDPRANDLRFTGVVFRENADQWVDQVTDVFPTLEVVEADAGHVILRAQLAGGTADAH